MLWWSRRQRQRQRTQPQIKEHYGASSVHTQDRIEEAGEGRIVMYEIDGEEMPNELHGRSRAELSGDTGALERR